MAKEQKKRVWEIIGYPDSLPRNWKEILEQTGLPVAISPLHDKDEMDSGDLKKAHYHILVAYQGPTTASNVKTLSDKLNSPLPQYKDSIKGAYEYHWHKNSPDKYQYDQKEEQYLNNFDIRDYYDLTDLEKRQLKINVSVIIRDNQFDEYADLVFYLEQTEQWNEYDYVTEHTILFNGILSSIRYKNENKSKQKQIEEQYGDMPNQYQSKRFENDTELTKGDKKRIQQLEKYAENIENGDFNKWNTISK